MGYLRFTTKGWIDKKIKVCDKDKNKTIFYISKKFYEKILVNASQDKSKNFPIWKNIKKVFIFIKKELLPNLSLFPKFSIKKQLHRICSK